MLDVDGWIGGEAIADEDEAEEEKQQAQRNADVEMHGREGWGYQKMMFSPTAPASTTVPSVAGRRYHGVSCSRIFSVRE